MDVVGWRYVLTEKTPVYFRKSYRVRYVEIIPNGDELFSLRNLTTVYHTEPIFVPTF